MGVKVNFEDDSHKILRERSSKFYHEGHGKKLHRLRYLRKHNNINDEDLTCFDTLDDKIKHCEMIHIKRKHKHLFE